MRCSFLKTMLILLVASFLLAGCSTRFVYNKLDWLAPWYLDDYVTIESGQQSSFKASLNSVLDWHRATQLIRYADFLATLSIDVEANVSQAKLAEQVYELDGFIQTLFTQFGQDFAPLMAQMSAAQQAELIENLDLKNQEYYKERVLIGEVESKERSKERLTDFLDDWLDGLHANQEQMIVKWSAELKWLAPGFYKNRQAWSRHLRAIFSEHEVNKAQRIKDMFKDRRQFWSPELSEQFAYNQQVTVAFVVNLINSLNAEQKVALLKNLKQFEADFRSLASQSDAT